MFGLPESVVDEALQRLDDATVIGEITRRRDDGALIEVVAPPTLDD